MPSLDSSASHSVIMPATTTVNGPAIRIHGHGSRYQGLAAGFSLNTLIIVAWGSWLVVRGESTHVEYRLLIGFDARVRAVLDMKAHRVRARRGGSGIDAQRDRQRERACRRHRHGLLRDQLQAVGAAGRDDEPV